MSVEQTGIRFKINRINFCICLINFILLITGCTSKGEMNMHNESESIIAETRAFADAWNRDAMRLKQPTIVSSTKRCPVLK